MLLERIESLITGTKSRTDRCSRAATLAKPSFRPLSSLQSRAESSPSSKNHFCLLDESRLTRVKWKVPGPPELPTVSTTPSREDRNERVFIMKKLTHKLSTRHRASNKNHFNASIAALNSLKLLITLSRNSLFSYRYLQRTKANEKRFSLYRWSWKALISKETGTIREEINRRKKLDASTRGATIFATLQSSSIPVQPGERIFFNKRGESFLLFRPSLKPSAGTKIILE